jgi:hypothetical protein
MPTTFLAARWNRQVNDNAQLPDLADRDSGVKTTLPCSELPGANDTVVVMKTGSTELQDKLPVHLRTTLRCFSNHMIFSDFAEQYQNEHILDALEDVDPTIKATHPDFALYRQLQQAGRTSLDPAELSGPVSLPQEGTTGNLGNPGWRLDKWKFLPMARRTLQEYPDKQWYVFTETDTYLFWGTLLAYLAALDPSKPYYLGSQSQIDDVIFAHGGSGFVASRSALTMAVANYTADQEQWETFTADHWAGDCVLGKAFKDSGTSLTWAWPIWQGDKVGTMDYVRVDYGRALWCSPTISYHHLSPSAVEDLWNFEQAWFSRKRANDSLVLRHRDVYAQYILPRTLDSRSDWDNRADQDRGSVSSFDDCRLTCEDDVACLQFSFDHRNGKCLTTSRPNLGDVSSGIQSGWVSERMLEFLDKAQVCGREQWIT